MGRLSHGVFMEMLGICSWWIGLVERGLARGNGGLGLFVDVFLCKLLIYSVRIIST